MNTSAEVSSVALTAALTPAVLRGMDDTQLTELAANLRHHLIQSVAARGGHLGPNLGVVELTLALHRVFDSPRDVLLWDTGHQSYIHKMVTGRAERFNTLRAWGGLAGYPDPSESEHDWVQSSHAGNGLAYAAGFALGRPRDSGHVVAVVGDGALTAGVALEALNDVIVRNPDLILVVNDNGRSYAPTTGALAAVLRRARDSATARDRIGRAGVPYQGPVDGHDRGALENALLRAAAAGGLQIVHTITEKGHGYPPAVLDTIDHLHGVGPFDPADGRPASAPAEQVPVTDILGTALVEAGQQDGNLHVVTAAMGSASGLDPFREAFPDRFHDVGIAEQYAVTLACGLAMGGAQPVVAIHSAFLGRAFDQILYEVGLHGLPVVFLVDRAGITGGDGPSHNGLYDLAIATHVPGALVLAPADAPSLRAAVIRALSASGPVFVRYPRALPAGPVTVGPATAGRRLLVIGYGRTVPLAVEVAGLLRDRGVPAVARPIEQVLPVPADVEADVEDSDLIGVLEDHGVVGGFAEALARISGPATAARLRVVGPPAGHFPPHGDVPALWHALRLDAQSVVEDLERAWSELANVSCVADAARH